MATRKQPAKLVLQAKTVLAPNGRIVIPAAIREELGFSVIFITHDLSLLLEVSDRLAVMYAGEIVEWAPSELGRKPALKGSFAG